MERVVSWGCELLWENSGKGGMSFEDQWGAVG